MNCPACGAYNPGDSGAACLRCGALLPLSVAPDAPRCPAHPEVQAVGTCARCGTFGCGACLQQVGGKAYCPKCVGHASDLPWDRRGELGALKAWWLTSWRLMGQPTAALSQARPGDSAGSSLFFASLAVLAGYSATVLFYGALLAIGGLAALAGPEAAELKSAHLGPGFMAGLFVGYSLLLYVMSVAAVLFFALLDHLLLQLFGGTAGGFEVSLRANALALAPYVLGLIPVCGLYVFGLWSVVLRIIALSSLHKVSGGKAAAVVLAPVLLCCGGVFLVGMVAAVAGAGH